METTTQIATNKKGLIRLTTVYFVRHAKPNYAIHNDFIRPLTNEGLQDSKKVTAFFEDKTIDLLFSSPYKRAIETISHLANRKGLPIKIIDDFRERNIQGDFWIEDFKAYAQKQWEDFSYKLSGGESLAEVQQRNMEALHKILLEHQNKTIVIGTHGTALSTINNFYNPTFLWDDFQRIAHIMPFVVKITFDITKCIEIKEYLV